MIEKVSTWFLDSPMNSSQICMETCMDELMFQMSSLYLQKVPKCFTKNTFFHFRTRRELLYFFAWVAFCVIFVSFSWVYRRNGNKSYFSRQYTCTTKTVVHQLISSLSRSISGSNWVRGAVLCECLVRGIWDCLVMKPVAFYLLFGACQQYKCVCVSQKLVSNSFGYIIVIMLLFRHFSSFTFVLLLRLGQ